MRPADLILYLFGHRGAIERIAGSRWAWAVGAVLVVTAGIARNYDHLYLLRQPEALAGPFLASLFTTVFIFYWANVVLRFGRRGPLVRQHVTFLALVWLTSPCAWLYGLPVESWTDLVTATKWNIAFLAVVSLWRVAIITRAFAVLSGVHWIRCLAAILAPAALEMMVGSFFKHLSLVGIMGGVRLPPHHEILRDATEFTTTASLITFVIALVATPFIKRGQRAIEPLQRPAVATPRMVWMTALLLLVGWILATVPMQVKVRNKYLLESYLREDRFTEAVQFASGLTRADFPPAHFLPPDPYSRAALNLPFLLSIPPEAPAWLKEEWRENALVSLRMRWWLNSDEWVQLRGHHLGLAEELAAHAERLRSKLQRTSDETYWLKSYDDK